MLSPARYRNLSLSDLRNGNPIVLDFNLENLQWFLGRSFCRSSGFHAEPAGMQGAFDLSPFEPAIRQAGVAMRAEILGGEHPFLGVVDRQPTEMRMIHRQNAAGINFTQSAKPFAHVAPQ